MATQQPITGDMRVAQVLERYPQTYDVFRKHGCPDMRKGFFAVSARFMKIRWAARVHGINANDMLGDLNAAVGDSPRQAA